MITAHTFFTLALLSITLTTSLPACGMETPGTNTLLQSDDEVTKTWHAIGAIQKTHEHNGNYMGAILDQAYDEQSKNEQYVVETIQENYSSKEIVRSAPPFVVWYKNSAGEIIIRVSYTSRSDMTPPREYFVHQHRMDIQNRDVSGGESTRGISMSETLDMQSIMHYNRQSLVPHDNLRPLLIERRYTPNAKIGYVDVEYTYYKDPSKNIFQTISRSQICEDASITRIQYFVHLFEPSFEIEPRATNYTRMSHFSIIRSSFTRPRLLYTTALLLCAALGLSNYCWGEKSCLPTFLRATGEL